MKNPTATLSIKEPKFPGGVYTAWLNWSDGDISACSADSVTEIMEWAASYKAVIRV